jgi:hypothetical protein
VKQSSLDAFDFLVVAFLNIGKFYGGRDGTTGGRDPEFYTLPASFIRKHHDVRSTWLKVRRMSRSSLKAVVKEGKLVCDTLLKSVSPARVAIPPPTESTSLEVSEYWNPAPTRGPMPVDSTCSKARSEPRADR